MVADAGSLIGIETALAVPAGKDTVVSGKGNIISCLLIHIACFEPDPFLQAIAVATPTIRVGALAEPQEPGQSAT